MRGSFNEDGTRRNYRQVRGGFMKDIFLQLRNRKVLSLFFTAGYPRRDDTREVLRAAQQAGVDMVEIGFPFSDPIADGPTIQRSNLVALRGGMTVARLFEQLAGMRPEISIPVLLMGYLNPLEQFGSEQFLEDAHACGVNALIVPDLPVDEYRSRYQPLYEKHSIRPVFLVTPRTPPERIRVYDQLNPAFLYIVSSDAVTGGSATISEDRQEFFRSLRSYNLVSPCIVGFGVADQAGFQAATRHTDGAIIGSAFVRALEDLPAQRNGEEFSTVHSDPRALQDRVLSFVTSFRSEDLAV
jgi:tryptophan synthase alpha chain